jgi:energy-coupling factor transport system ATP-binding protein
MDFIKSDKLIYEYKIYNEDKGQHDSMRALDGVSLNVPEGQFLAVLGHNGSGKSTLAKHINALLLPSEGTMYVNGMDTSDEDCLWKIRQSAGMVFQNPDNQLIANVVEEDIAFGPENLGIESSEIRKRVSDALETVGMTKFRRSAPSMLSGGQKQRIAIAGILAMKPRCIVLDEPTAMLDPVGRKNVMETIIRLNREEHITIVLITHYMEEAALADRVVVMDAGKPVMDGTPIEVFSKVDEMKRLRLDVPQATELIYELNKWDFELKKDVLTMEDAVDALLKHGFKGDINDIDIVRTQKEKENSETAIAVRDLTYIYGKNTAFERVALSNVSFEIYKGEFIGLIGHTGSGKSTLIQHLNGLIKTENGKIFAEGKDITDSKQSLTDIRQKIGLVFQYPEHQLFEETIYKDVAFGPKNMGISGDELRERVRESLELVGMDESFFEKSPFELSGGQKRRVAIAGVLAMKPSVLILDEPAAGLDPYARDEILNNIKNMHERLGITVILVSHSMEDISRLADRILVMNNGEVEMFDTVAKVFGNARRLSEIGLAVPQISTIFDKLRNEGIMLPRDVYTVDDAVNVLSNLLR